MAGRHCSSFTTDVMSAVFLVVAILFSETEAQCSGTLELTARPYLSSSLLSPNYPGPYPAEASCSWLLRTVSPGYILKLEVIELNLELDSSCRYDRLGIFDGVSSLSRRLGTLCGTRRNVTYYSTGSAMFVSFTSDGSRQFSGFSIVYSAVPLAVTTTYSPPWMTTKNETEAQCSGTKELTAWQYLSSSLSSPNYPLPYPAHASCSWLLRTVSPGYIIKLDVIDLNLEWGNSCRNDRLGIFDGDSEYSRRIASLCGSSSRQTFYSSGSTALVSFTSDGSVQESGFRITYTAMPSTTSTPWPWWIQTTTLAEGSTSSVCINGDNGGATLTATTLLMKYIQSPNYPGRYPDDASCAWKLQTDPGYVIHVRVIDMDLEGTPACSIGTVNLYDASWEFIPLAILCSTSSASDYYSTGNYMFITFKSYSSHSFSIHRGFWLMYEAVPGPASTEQPFPITLQSTARTGIIVGIVVGVIIIAGCFVLIVFTFKRRQTALKRSRRAQDGRRDERPPYTTPASHFVLGGTALGPPGFAPGVGGQQAYTSPGYAHTEGYGPPPAYTELHGIARISSASGYVINQYGSLGDVDGQGARIGSDTAAADPVNGDPRAKESLLVLAPPAYESLDLPQASAPFAAPSYWFPAEAAVATRPLPSPPLSA